MDYALYQDFRKKSELITKTVASGKDRKINIRQLMYDIYPEYNVGSF